MYAYFMFLFLHILNMQCDESIVMHMHTVGEYMQLNTYIVHMIQFLGPSVWWVFDHHSFLIFNLLRCYQGG